ncbi:MAG: hypothetical protein Ta2D_01420 [Rickettsiales bacterium]|nr:MAG: hypothetical protein Ta2D_01420 [Rickettsiales bacterium]
MDGNGYNLQNNLLKGNVLLHGNVPGGGVVPVTCSVEVLLKAIDNSQNNRDIGDVFASVEWSEVLQIYAILSVLNYSESIKNKGDTQGATASKDNYFSSKQNSLLDVMRQNQVFTIQQNTADRDADIYPYPILHQQNRRPSDLEYYFPNGNFDEGRYKQAVRDRLILEFQFAEDQNRSNINFPNPLPYLDGLDQTLQQQCIGIIQQELQNITQNHSRFNSIACSIQPLNPQPPNPPLLRINPPLPPLNPPQPPVSLASQISPSANYIKAKISGANQQNFMVAFNNAMQKDLIQIATDVQNNASNPLIGMDYVCALVAKSIIDSNYNTISVVVANAANASLNKEILDICADIRTNPSLTQEQTAILDNIEKFVSQHQQRLANLPKSPLVSPSTPSISAAGGLPLSSQPPALNPSISAAGGLPLSSNPPISPSAAGGLPLSSNPPPSVGAPPPVVPPKSPPSIPSSVPPSGAPKSPALNPQPQQQAATAEQMMPSDTYFQNNMINGMSAKKGFATTFNAMQRKQTSEIVNVIGNMKKKDNNMDYLMSCLSALVVKSILINDATVINTFITTTGIPYAQEISDICNDIHANAISQLDQTQKNILDNIAKVARQQLPPKSPPSVPLSAQPKSPPPSPLVQPKSPPPSPLNPPKSVVPPKSPALNPQPQQKAATAEQMMSSAALSLQQKQEFDKILQLATDGIVNFIQLTSPQAEFFDTYLSALVVKSILYNNATAINNFITSPAGSPYINKIAAICDTISKTPINQKQKNILDNIAKVASQQLQLKSQAPNPSVPPSPSPKSPSPSQPLSPDPSLSPVPNGGLTPPSVVNPNSQPLGTNPSTPDLSANPSGAPQPPFKLQTPRKNQNNPKTIIPTAHYITTNIFSCNMSQDIFENIFNDDIDKTLTDIVQVLTTTNFNNAPEVRAHLFALVVKSIIQNDLSEINSFISSKDDSYKQELRNICLNIEADTNLAPEEQNILNGIISLAHQQQNPPEETKPVVKRRYSMSNFSKTKKEEEKEEEEKQKLKRQRRLSFDFNSKIEPLFSDENSSLSSSQKIDPTQPTAETIRLSEVVPSDAYFERYNIDKNNFNTLKEIVDGDSQLISIIQNFENSNAIITSDTNALSSLYILITKYPINSNGGILNKLASNTKFASAIIEICDDIFNEQTLYDDRDTQSLLYLKDLALQQIPPTPIFPSDDYIKNSGIDRNDFSVMYNNNIVKSYSDIIKDLTDNSHDNKEIKVYLYNLIAKYSYNYERDILDFFAKSDDSCKKEIISICNDITKNSLINLNQYQKDGLEYIIDSITQLLPQTTPPPKEEAPQFTAPKIPSSFTTTPNSKVSKNTTPPQFTTTDSTPKNTSSFTTTTTSKVSKNTTPPPSSFTPTPIFQAKRQVVNNQVNNQVVNYPDNSITISELDIDAQIDTINQASYVDKTDNTGLKKVEKRTITGNATGLHLELSTQPVNVDISFETKRGEVLTLKQTFTKILEKKENLEDTKEQMQKMLSATLSTMDKTQRQQLIKGFKIDERASNVDREVANKITKQILKELNLKKEDRILIKQ